MASSNGCVQMLHSRREATSTELDEEGEKDEDEDEDEGRWRFTAEDINARNASMRSWGAADMVCFRLRIG